MQEANDGSAKLYRKPYPRNAQSARVGAMVLLQLLLLGAYGCPSGSENEVRPPSSPLVFSGPSDQLTRTVIVPGLQTPMPKGKNVVWCASFQLAWNYLRDRIVKEPIRIKNAEVIADRLNSSKLTESDLPDGSFYSNAGFGNTAQETAAPGTIDPCACTGPSTLNPPSPAGLWRGKRREIRLRLLGTTQDKTADPASAVAGLGRQHSATKQGNDWLPIWGLEESREL